jgi:hypothetical protein
MKKKNLRKRLEVKGTEKCWKIRNEINLINQLYLVELKTKNKWLTLIVTVIVVKMKHGKMHGF